MIPSQKDIDPVKAPVSFLRHASRTRQNYTCPMAYKRKVETSDLTSNQQAIVLKIHELLEMQGVESAVMYYAFLATACACSPKTVARAIPILVVKGWLRVKQKYNANGMHYEMGLVLPEAVILRISDAKRVKYCKKISIKDKMSTYTNTTPIPSGDKEVVCVNSKKRTTESPSLREASVALAAERRPAIPLKTEPDRHSEDFRAIAIAIEPKSMEDAQKRLQGLSGGIAIARIAECETPKQKNQERLKIMQEQCVLRGYIQKQEALNASR